MELPGERAAIEVVIQMGEQFGYGNMIHRLSDAWSKKLQESGLPRLTADLASGHICVWCNIDKRTGKKV